MQAGGPGGRSLLGTWGLPAFYPDSPSPDPRPWTSCELNAFGGKPLRGHERRPCWPGSEEGHNRRSSRKRQMIGGGGTTPSSTRSWPGAPAGRTPPPSLTPEGYTRGCCCQPSYKTIYS